MSIQNQSDFDEARARAIALHNLHREGLTPKGRSFSALHIRFFDGNINVELLVSWESPEGLQTLALHRNHRGDVILAFDSRRGRIYHFPAEWLGSSTSAVRSEIEVNAWSRFSPTPDGPLRGYKQHRFSRSEELYFHGSRILEINGTKTSGQHTGKMLYAALKAHPDKLSLTIES